MISRLVLSLKEAANDTESVSEESFTTASFSTSFSARELDLSVHTPTYDPGRLPLRARRRQASPDPDAE